jgi:hypothetical protein
MKHCMLLILLASLFACSSHRVIIDKQGVDMAQYEADRQECEAYAEEVPVGEEVAKGAARGGFLWAVYGAIFGDSRTVARTAGAGAVGGGAQGGVKAEAEQDRVIKNCLRNRGYKVLNLAMR